MRITLVDNVLLEKSQAGYTVDLQPHLGLISLIAVLRRSGHTATLLDPKLDLVAGRTHLGPHFYHDVAARIVAGNPDLVGFTSLGCNFVCTLKIARHVRAYLPQTPIVLGGPHASILDREILERYAVFDAIVRNEAEATIGDIVDAFGGRRELSSVLGTTYRAGGTIVRTRDAGPVLDLDALPFPAYDSYPIAELGLTGLRVDAGRGCPFGCTFCSTASFFGRRYRLKSAQRLVGELDRLAVEYGIGRFALTHDLFTVDKAKVRAFCAAVTGRGYSWSCSARMDCVDPDLLAEMRAAGCTSIYYGVETGSARLQPLVGKHLDLGLYRPIVAASIDLGMNPIASFITGFPNETPADAEQTLELIGETIERNAANVDVHLHLLTPEPGTGLTTQFGAALAYDGHINDFNFPALEADDAQLMAADPVVFICHHYFAAGIERRANIALTEGYRALYALGPHLLRALARDYGDTFFALVRRCGEFALDRGLTPERRLWHFIADRWGLDHPLTDAVKYLLAFKSLRPDAAPRVAGVAAGVEVRLPGCIRALDEMRDGSEVLRRLELGRDIGSPPLARSCYLLVAAPNLEQCTMFPIDRLTFALATRLEAPAGSEALAEICGAAELEPRLWTLGMLGALVAATQARSERASRPTVVASA